VVKGLGLIFEVLAVGIADLSSSPPCSREMTTMQGLDQPCGEMVHRKQSVLFREGMMKFGLLVSVALIVLTNTAFAQSKHERDIQTINASLQTAHLTPAKRAEVIKLRNEGAAFHHAGKHGKAEAVLEKAKAILRGG
jgi:hypothetical protein